MSSYFPSSVPTTLQLFTAKNNISVVLSSAINDIITTLPVVDTSNLPNSGYVTAEDGSNEVIYYAGKTSNTLTGCIRGADGTAASSHASASTLGMWWNADYHNILAVEIVGIAQNLSDRIGLSATQLLGTAGTALLPTYAFSADPDTGMYSFAANVIGFSSSGVAAATIGSYVSGLLSGIATVAGSVGTPSYTFSGDTDTGIYSVGANTIGITTNGVLALSISASVITAVLPFGFANGTAGSPSITFSADTDTGFYRTGANSLGLSVGGSLLMEFDPGVITPGVDNTVAIGSTSLGFTRIFMKSGSTSLPAFTFRDDDNTGIYRASADVFGIAAGGGRIAEFSTSTVLITAPGGGDLIDLTGSSAGTVSIRFGPSTATSNAARIRGTANGVNTDLTFLTSALARVTFDASGNVGIGQTVPVSIFDVESTTGEVRFTMKNQTTASVVGLDLQSVHSAVAQRWLVGNNFANTDGSFEFRNQTTGANIMELTSVVKHADGSSGTPGLTFIADPDTGFYRGASGQTNYSGNAFVSVIFAATGNSDGTTYEPVQFRGGAGTSNGSFGLDSATQQVGTSALTIYNSSLGDGNFVVVHGKNGSAQFLDILISTFSTTTPTVVSSLSTGGAVARTYAQGTAGAITLQMASGSYNVHAVGLAIATR